MFSASLRSTCVKFSCSVRVEYRRAFHRTGNPSFWGGFSTFILLVMLSAASSQVAADTVAVDKSLFASQYPVTLEDHWYYSDQLSEEASVQQVLADFNTGRWQVVHDASANFGVTTRPHWFTFELTSKERLSLLVELEYALLDNIEFYILQNGVVTENYLTGDHYYFQVRPIKNRNFLFPLELRPDQPVRVIFKVQTGGSLQVPLLIWSRASHQFVNEISLVLHAFFAGIMLTIAIYNLMLFISSRDQVFLFYSLYVGCVAMTQLALRGLSYQLLWQESPYWNERSLMFFAGAAIAMGAMFIYRFLRIRDTGRISYFMVCIMVGAGIVQATLSFVLPYYVSVTTGILAASLACVLMFVLGIGAWKRGLKAGKYYTYAWSFFLIGLFSALMAKLGLVPRTTFIEYGPELGAAIEVILLSFAVADRMNEDRRQRIKMQEVALNNEIKLREAQERALEIQATANLKLEDNVRQRTIELQSALEELSSANSKLRLLNTIDGLTQVRNRRHFDEILATEWSRAKRNSEPLVLILLDADHFKQINDTYGHLAGDECLKALAGILENQILRPTDCIARFGGEEFAIILADTDEEGALQVGERLREAVAAQAVNAEGVSIKLTISVGIGFGTPRSGEQVETLLSVADKALYRAKTEGRNRVVLAHIHEQKEASGC